MNGGDARIIAEHDSPCLHTPSTILYIHRSVVIPRVVCNSGVAVVDRMEEQSRVRLFGKICTFVHSWERCSIPRLNECRYNCSVHPLRWCVFSPLLRQPRKLRKIPQPQRSPPLSLLLPSPSPDRALSGVFCTDRWCSIKTLFCLTTVGTHNLRLCCRPPLSPHPLQPSLRPILQPQTRRKT